MQYCTKVAVTIFLELNIREKLPPTSKTHGQGKSNSKGPPMRSKHKRTVLI